MLKGTTKVTTEDVLKLNTLKGGKTAFLTPKRYDEYPCNFYMGVPLGIQEVAQESARVRNNLRNIHIRRELFYSLFFNKNFCYKNVEGDI